MTDTQPYPQELAQLTRTILNETDVTNLNPISTLVRTCQKKEI
jgi:hypothetical protein